MSDILLRLAELSQSMMEGYPLNDGDFTVIDSAIDKIQQLEADLKNIRSGFEGCCNTCEPIGELNNSLKVNNNELRLTIRTLEQQNQELLEYNNKLQRHLRIVQRRLLDNLCRQDEELGLL